jgi:hypothetical protein
MIIVFLSYGSSVVIFFIEYEKKISIYLLMILTVNTMKLVALDPLDKVDQVS